MTVVTVAVNLQVVKGLVESQFSIAVSMMFQMAANVNKDGSLAGGDVSRRAGSSNMNGIPMAEPKIAPVGAPLLFPILCLTASLIFILLLNRRACESLANKCLQSIYQSYIIAKDQIFQQWFALPHNTATANELELRYGLLTPSDTPTGSTFGDENDEYIRMDWESGDGWIDILVDNYVRWLMDSDWDDDTW
ncbi:unnamed protein product [Penicillium pancosmium]